MRIELQLVPALADGFTHLDVELAGLLARHLNAQGFDMAHPDSQWWCAAAAITSRAHAQGHVCLQLPGHALRSDIDGLIPAEPSLTNPFKDFLQRFISYRASRISQTQGPWKALEQAVLGSGLLVSEGNRLYLRRQWAAECRVARALAERARAAMPLTPEHQVRAQALLEQWFDSSKCASSEDQQHACLQGAQSLLTVVTGGPGTGKTFTAARMIALLQALQSQGSLWLRVALAAPTGKAAARLRQSLEQAWSNLRGCGLHAEFWDGAWGAMQEPRTVHALLAQWRRESQAIPQLFNPAPDPVPEAHGAYPLDVLLIDEASMLDLDLLDELLQALPPRARLVLMGDRDQLASVEAGSVMSDICLGLTAHPSLAVLHNSRRFQGTIGRLATGLKAGDPIVLSEIEHHAQNKLNCLVEQACGPEGWAPFLQAVISLRQPLSSNLKDAHECWPDDKLRAVLQNLDQFRVLAGTRRGSWGVESLNGMIEAALAAKGLIDRHSRWPHGRVLMVTRNDDATGLRNGDVGVVLVSPSGKAQFAWIAGQVVRRVGVARLPHTELAYAMTIHKSQGSEFNRVLLALPDSDSPVLTRELLYTGLTRTRSDVKWFIPAPALLAQAAGRTIQRMSGLGERLRAAFACG